MKRPILTLRVSRRAVGAAVLDGEILTLADGRHLTSQRDRAGLAVGRYVTRLLDLSKPRSVVLDARRVSAEQADPVVAAIQSVLHDRHVDVFVVARHEILGAYGVRPRQNRAEVRLMVQAFWGDLGRVAGRVQPYVADAAAAALYAESRFALNPPHT